MEHFFGVPDYGYEHGVIIQHFADLIKIIKKFVHFDFLYK